MNLVVKKGAMGPRVDLKLVRKDIVVENFSINQQIEIADVKEPVRGGVKKKLEFFDF